MRIIKLDGSKITDVKYVLESYELRSNEIESSKGEIGQIMQADGTFITPEPESIEPMPTLEEMQTQTLLNTEYLVIISEISTL